MTSTIAFLGAGRMGRGMIANLRGAGHSVVVYNRSRSALDALAGSGITIAETPAQAVNGADIVWSMVTGDEASAMLWEGPGGALSGDIGPGTIAIESSTVSIERVATLCAAATERGLRFMDCPVAGRPDVASAGALTVFAGGDSQSLLQVAAPLDAISRKVLHMGPVGSGIRFKLLYNAVGAIQIASIGEAMAACRRAGLDLSVATTAFSEGATGSPHVKLHAQKMASGDYPDPPEFTPAGRIKDLTYAIDLAIDLSIEPLLSVAARSAFQRADRDGLDSISDSQVVDYFGRDLR